MDFDLTEDQSLVMNMIDRLASAYERSDNPPVFWLPGEAIEKELEESGFFGLARGDGGAVDAALMIERIARLPHSVEVSASALVAPLLTEVDLPRAFALATGIPGKAVRFLDRAATLLVDDGTALYAIPADALSVEPCESIFGYSFGRVNRFPFEDGTRLDATVERFHTLWQIALTNEIAGAAAGALAKTVEYVKDRQQFGRAIGSFQAVQHRLSECAVAVRSISLLGIKAAASQTRADAAMAAVFAQNSIGMICYDLQQFHGAIGLTLEYPSHFWAQRLRTLQGELGGATAIAAGVDLGELCGPGILELANGPAKIAATG